MGAFSHPNATVISAVRFGLNEPFNLPLTHTDYLASVTVKTEAFEKVQSDDAENEENEGGHDTETENSRHWYNQSLHGVG